MPATVFLNGDFLPKDQATLSPDDRGFLFADGVYEALCAYDGRLFLADEHFARLRRSLQALRIETDLTAERFAWIASELVERNGLADRNAKVYLQVTRGAPPERGHAFPTPPPAPTVYATASAYDLPHEQWERGVKVLLCPDERWGRCDIKSVSLLPNVLANQRAAEAGAFEAVLVREPEGGEVIVTEGSHSSFAAVVDGAVVTHPLGPAILPGVTRGLALHLARAHGIPVREERLPAHRLRDADELFLIGTTTGVMPVTEVEWAPAVPVDAGGQTEDQAAAGGQRREERSEGTRTFETPGPVTRRLQEAFRKAREPGAAPTLTGAAFLEATP